jgi:two-component system response regulator NreC
MPVRIVLADDHVLVRQGLKSLLERENFQVVAEASDGQEAVRLTETHHPDICVIDISMPTLNGIDAARALVRSCPKTKCILLTQHEEDQYIHEALEAGVKGYVLKNQVAGELILAIQRVSRGEFYLSPGISRAVVEAYRSKSERPADPLTVRERQVLQLIAEGKSTKDAASLLSISVKTAESHRMRLMQKLDIHETATLVRYAVRRGLVQA